MKGLELVGHLQITTYTLFLFIFCDLLVMWAPKVGSLLPDFYTFKFYGSFFHFSKLNVVLEFDDFESYHVCALISFGH